MAPHQRLPLGLAHLGQVLVLPDHPKESVSDTGKDCLISEVSDAVRLFAIVAYQLDREISHSLDRARC
jgi:hypothetical protein